MFIPADSERPRRDLFDFFGINIFLPISGYAYKKPPLVVADLRNLVIRNPPLVVGQNYLRKHNICQKFSRLRREIIYENTTFAKILDNKGGSYNRGVSYKHFH